MTYKLSNYNYFIEHEGRMIYFNGMSGVSFTMSMKEHEKMSFLMKNLSTFESDYKSVFERFREWGFIVPEIYQRNRCVTV